MSEPESAFDRLVHGVVPLGVAAPLTLGEILYDVFEPGDIELDTAAATWLDKHILGEVPNALTLDRWVTVLEEFFRGIALMELPKTGEILRNQHRRLCLWLHGFYEGPDRDPEGAYLLALTRSQNDQRFSKLWRRLILGYKTAGRPYLGVGILGFRKMPGKDGRASADVPEGLLQALLKLAEEPGVKHIKWKQTLRSVFAAYRRTEKYWVERILPMLPDRRQQSNARDWLSILLPSIVGSTSSGSSSEGYLLRTQAVSRETCEYWVQRARKSPSECNSVEFLSFLEQHRDYARTTGDAEYLNKTFNNLSTSIVRADRKMSDISLGLIGEALEWVPSDSRNWISYAIVLDAAHRKDDAISALWEARYRFAYEPFIRNELGRLLRDDGDLVTSESVFLEAISHFPNDVVCRTGLGETLRAMERFDDAYVVYEQACRDFPDNSFCRNGLAETLRGMGQFNEALEVYKKACRDSTDLACRSGLAELLIDLDNPDEAEKIYREALKLDGQNFYIKSGLARALSIRSARTRDIGLRDEAKSILQELARKGIRSAVSGLRYFDAQWEQATTDPTVKFRKSSDSRAVKVLSVSGIKAIAKMSIPERLGRAMICLWQAERTEDHHVTASIINDANALLDMFEDQIPDDLLSAFVEIRGLILLARGDARRSLSYFEDQIKTYGRGSWISVRLGMIRAQTLLGDTEGVDDLNSHFTSKNSRFALQVAKVIQALSGVSSGSPESSVQTLLIALYPDAVKFASRTRLDIKGGLSVSSGGEMLGAFLQTRWFRAAGIQSSGDLERPDAFHAVITQISSIRDETFDVISNSTFSLAA
ncbi:tetratricopeptide repeat protein [Pseudomonas weihenstephanensis]|uniref:tetratricopeptide repeat protein n=1 Tax=Pseudomonas weihenstephanensis TaxID=1608994 RepID=UPI00193C7934|nr:tetratricopeptide repeat protein [Pseudomonas weihenstephanensis]